MNQRFPRLLSFLCLCLLPATVAAQCPRSTGTDQDKLCWNLQYILYAAQTDYREFRAPHGPHPNVSFGAIKVPCEVSAWLNNVAMYVCAADVSLPEGQEWYAKTMASLQQLQYLWHFQIESSGADHFVDAGPPGCEVSSADADWPYIGECPLHLQEVRQPDGTSKIYLSLNSYTSPYLAQKPPAPPLKDPVHQVPGPQSASESAPVSPSCDELCQELKRVLQARSTSFRELFAVHAGGQPSNIASHSDVTLKLSGATGCAVDTTAADNSALSTADRKLPASDGARIGSVATAKFRMHGDPAQYVCYWPEESASAAETRFRDLSSRIQVAMPSNWFTREEQILDALSGAKLRLWLALDPENRPAVRLYLSGQSVGLHVSGAD